MGLWVVFFCAHSHLLRNFVKKIIIIKLAGPTANESRSIFNVSERWRILWFAEWNSPTVSTRPSVQKVHTRKQYFVLYSRWWLGRWWGLSQLLISQLVVIRVKILSHSTSIALPVGNSAKCLYATLIDLTTNRNSYRHRFASFTNT